MNGKLELFLITFERNLLLKYLEEYFEVISENEYLSSFNFSLFIQAEDENKVILKASTIRSIQ